MDGYGWCRLSPRPLEIQATVTAASNTVLALDQLMERYTYTVATWIDTSIEGFASRFYAATPVKRWPAVATTNTSVSSPVADGDTFPSARLLVEVPMWDRSHWRQSTIVRHVLAMVWWSVCVGLVWPLGIRVNWIAMQCVSALVEVAPPPSHSITRTPYQCLWI